MSAATANFINQTALNVGGAVTGLGHTVLISGVTGFVGTHVALEFVKRGFSIHATARSQDKADEWNKLHPIAAVRTKWFIVKDAIIDGAFDESVKGVDIVVHTASPFHYHAKDPEKDMLIPAINGTLSILKSAANEPSQSVKRMVITSSFAANLDFDKLGPNKTYTENDWNPATRESAIEKAESSPGYLYCASKALAEKAAWDFVEKEKPSFDLTTICPPMIYGPPEQVISSMDGLNSSIADIWKIIAPKEKKVPATGFPVMVDVRDIAKIHALAAILDIAKGKRYLTVAHHFSYDNSADVLAQAFPDKRDRISAAEPSSGAEHFKTDSSKVERELGIEWISFEKSMVDTASKLFEIESELAKKN